MLATHSPILMAAPGASILALTDEGIVQVAWEDVEHVRLTRSFLEDPNCFLRHLSG